MVSEEWDVKSWSKCTKKCGGGKQTRSVTCRSTVSGDRVDDDNCPGKKPSISKKCNTQRCRSDQKSSSRSQQRGGDSSRSQPRGGVGSEGARVTLA